MRVPWRRASARRVPRASSVPNGRDIRAAQIESRPKRVRYHGEPAAAKTSVGSSGSVSSRCRRSTSDRCTVAASRESCEVTRTASQCTRSAPGPASNGVSAPLRAPTPRPRAWSTRPGGMESGQRRARAPTGVAVTAAPRATRVVAWRCVGPPAAVRAVARRAPARARRRARYFTACSSAPSPCASSRPRTRTSRAGPRGDGDLLGHPGVVQHPAPPHLDGGVGAGVADVAGEQQALRARARRWRRRRAPGGRRRR